VTQIHPIKAHAGSIPGRRSYPGIMRLLACGIFSAQAFANPEAVTLKEMSLMSLEDLMDVSIQSPAAQIRLDFDESPASLTSLTADDIQRTPARNIMDLIEIYVPGAIWMNYEEGPLVGIRGTIASRNNKYLLLLNGKVLSSKGLYGAKSEIEQWDLGDIKRLDIIRGPGSVTYGPGAVAGVISITTHDAKSLPRSRIAARYVHAYGSLGSAVSQGLSSKRVDLLAYASVTRTQGYAPLNYQGSNNNQPGYIGRDIRLTGAPLDYFADYQDIPQAKLFVDLRILQDWDIWARYTQEGATWSGNESKSLFAGDLVNQQSVRDRQFSGEVEYRRRLNSTLETEARFGADLFDVERRIDEVRGPESDDPRNFRSNYSESEYMAAGRVNYTPSPWLSMAMGGEVSLDSVGPGWFQGQESMRMGGDGIIVSGDDSRILGPNSLLAENAVFAGDGWSTHTFSAYAEAKLDPGRWPALILSGRADKNTYSQWLLSPRAALIGHPAEGQILKAIAQRSTHRNESGELFIEHQNGTEPTYESLVTYELIHQVQLRKNLATTLSGYYNDADIIDWDPVADRTVHLGRLRLAGFEGELAWNYGHGRWGANYSLLQQIDWEMADGITSTGISYSDYNQPLKSSKAIQTGYGEDLNNWPNQAFKAFGNYALADNLMLHGNGQFFWDYQGSRDGLAALERTAKGDSSGIQAIEAIRKVRQEGIFGLNFRLNLSAQYSPVPRLKATVSVQNLLGTGGNQRYAFDEGNNRLSPHRARYIREDRAFSLSLGYSL
jgi:outer membrane receptor protein involved in Fe transport